MVVKDAWSRRPSDGHPHEHVAKWLAYLLLQSEEYRPARQLFHKSVLISRGLGFTVRTIGLSSLGLLAITDKALGDDSSYAQQVAAFEADVAALVAESAPFAAYLNSVGGFDVIKGLLRSCERRNASSLARLLPFTYA
jgi:hypothetical protein